MTALTRLDGDKRFFLNYKSQTYNKKNEIYSKIASKLKNIIQLIPNGKLMIFPNYEMLNYCFKKWKKIFNPIPCFREFKGD